MNEEFVDEVGSSSSFDVKKFLFRSLSFWKYMLLLLIIGIVIVYQMNLREEFSYKLATKIVVEDDSNPLFTSNASLTFNWGGVTAKLQTMIVTLQSRTHHEKVVDRLQFYKSYLIQGRFRKSDAYKAVPFNFSHDLNKPQLVGVPIKIVFLNSKRFRLDVEFPGNSATVQNYITKELSKISVTPGIFTQEFGIGEDINLPFLSGSLNVIDGRILNGSEEFYVRFDNFNSIVASYMRRMLVVNPTNSPVLDIALIDKNKSKIVDYLNTVVAVLKEDQLERKNQYATNAILFIDEQISRVKGELSENAKALNDYRRDNKIYSLNEEGAVLNDKLEVLDNEKEGVVRQLNYYSNLENYLTTSNSFTEIPAPSIAGIADVNILANVSKINQLSVQKSKLQYSVKENASVFDDLNRQIDGLKNVLPENRLQILYFFLAILSALLIWRFAYINFITSPRFYRKVLLVGETSSIKSILKTFNDADPNYKIIGFINCELDKKKKVKFKDLREYHPKQIYQIIKDENISEVVVASYNSENITPAIYTDLITLLETGVPVKEYTQVYEELTQRVPVQYVGKDFYKYFPFSRSNQNKMYLFFHRLFDILISIIGLIFTVIFLPLVLLGNLIANRGALFYVQERIGKNGNLFKIIKYRTMVKNAEKNGAVWAKKNDVRITPFGKFMRNTRIDEMPQFINILKGEMSLIGPRPERPHFVRELSQLLPFYETRHIIKPGLTGWAQVKTRYGSPVDDSLVKLQYDLFYIKHRSFVLDVNILFKTLSTVIFFRGQ